MDFPLTTKAEDRACLQQLGQINALHEAPWIWQHVQKLQRPDLLPTLVERRLRGEPLAYVLGSWAFRSHEFFTGPGALVPRPETEELVGLALERLRELARGLPPTEAVVLVDAGAGTGCLGLALALELAGTLEGRPVHLHLIERSPEALPYLRRNVEASAAKNIHIHAGSWSTWSQQPCHGFFSNPPYVTEDELAALDSSVRDWEPKAALVPDDTREHPNASGPYRELLAIAQSCLLPGGWVGFELGPAQASWIVDWSKQHGGWQKPQILADMSGKERFFFAHN